MFQTCHPEYSDYMVDVSKPESKPPIDVRFGVAEAYGCVSAKHFDIVIEKIRQILHCKPFLLLIIFN